MLEPEEPVYMHLQSLLNQIEGRPIGLERLERVNDQYDPEMLQDFDILLIGRNTREKFLRTGGHQEPDYLELKNRLVSMASHEFRTPLTAISSSADLLDTYFKRGALDSMTKHIDRIKGSVRELTNILREFLSMEALENGKIQSNYREFNVTELIEEIQEDFSHYLKPGQTLEYRHKGDPCVVLDPFLLRQVLFNLLSNASKYSPETSAIRIESVVTEQQVQLLVRDKGIGIPEEEQRWIFNRFFRARNALNFQGTGIGLYLAKRYIEKMNGTIRFSSRNGKGATFEVTIPR